MRVQILRSSSSLVGHRLPDRELRCSKLEQLFGKSKVGIRPVPNPIPHEVEPRATKVLGPQGLRIPVIGGWRSKRTPERNFYPESDVTLGGNYIFTFLSISPSLPQTQVEQNLCNTVSVKCCLGLGTDRLLECVHKSETTYAKHLFAI